jgi:hypothetical protein
MCRRRTEGGPTRRTTSGKRSSTLFTSRNMRDLKTPSLLAMHKSHSTWLEPSTNLRTGTRAVKTHNIEVAYGCSTLDTLRRSRLRHSAGASACKCCHVVLLAAQPFPDQWRCQLSAAAS